jgi:hypothetical protein
MQRAAPRGRRGRHAGKDRAGKAPNHSRVASALPHSKGITCKSSNNEVVMCLRVGGWGRLSVDGPGQHNPDRSEGPWSRATQVARMAVLHRAGDVLSEQGVAVRPFRGSSRLSFDVWLRRIVRRDKSGSKPSWQG